MFSFIDFKDVVSELALHAESTMIIFTSGLSFYRMITALLAFLQGSFLFLILHEAGFFVLIMNWQP